MDKITKTTNLKWIAYALATLMLMQSCSVYHSKTATIDEAVAANSKVKIYTTDNQKYKFDKLVKEEGNIYGIKSLLRLNKDVFSKHVKEIDQEKGLVKILLPFDIKEIHTKNKTMSVIVSLWPVWIVGIVSLIIWANGGISVGR